MRLLSAAVVFIPSAGDDAVEGVVMDYSSKWVRVAVPQSVAGLLQGGPWRLDQYGNTTAHERYDHLVVTLNCYLSMLCQVSHPFANRSPLTLHGPCFRCVLMQEVQRSIVCQNISAAGWWRPPKLYSQETQFYPYLAA